MFNRKNQPYGKESLDAGVPDAPWYRRPWNWVKILGGLASVGVFTAAMVFAWPALVAAAGYAAVFTAVGAGFGIPSAYALGVGGTIFGLSTLGTAVSLFVGIRKLCTFVSEKRRTASVSVLEGFSGNYMPPYVPRDQLGKILARPQQSLKASKSPTVQQATGNLISFEQQYLAKIKDQFADDVEENVCKVIWATDRQKKVEELVEQLRFNFNYNQGIDLDNSKIKKFPNKCFEKIFNQIYIPLFRDGVYCGLPSEMNQDEKLRVSKDLLVQGMIQLARECIDDKETPFLQWLESEAKKFVAQKSFIPEKVVAAPGSPRPSIPR